MLDTLHGNGIEIMSPSFMNQRPIGDSTSMIPHVSGHAPEEELAVAVVERHAEHFTAQLTAALHDSKDVVAAARRMIAALAQLVEGGVGAGCPVGAVAFEMAERSDALRQATQAAFSTWTGLLAAALVDAGASKKDAQRRARVLLCAIEGALVLSRSAGDAGPLRDVSSMVAALLSA